MLPRWCSWLIVAAAFPLHAAGYTYGALSLDNTNFDKVRQINGVSLLAKVDAVSYDETSGGDFAKLCSQGQFVKNLLFGEVGVEEHGDQVNQDLAKRYKVKSSDFPVYLLFKPGQEEPLRFAPFPDPAAIEPHDWDADEDGEWEAPEITEATAENLAVWLRLQGIKIPAEGQILELDEAAEAFLKGGRTDSDLEAAKKVAEAYGADPKAAIYIKTMEKIKAKGVEYPEKEIARVGKIMDGKVTPAKRSELQAKVRILQVFAAAAKGI